VKCASEMIVGEHDLRAFGTAAGGRSTVRRVMRAEWRREPQLPWGAPIWQFSIEANGFLRGMVRRVVGTLVRVSEGHLEPDDVRDIIRAGDPARAGPPAPARGLFFWEAHYAGE